MLSQLRTSLLGCQGMLYSLLLFPKLFLFMQASKYYQEGRLEVDQKNPITIFDFTAVPHSYHRSVEAYILYIIVLPLSVCHNVELSFYFTFLFTHLTSEQLFDYFNKIPYIKKYLINVIGQTPSGPKSWQSLNHSSLSIPGQYPRIWIH